MILQNIIRSKLDATVKYVFLSEGQIIEFSYIDKKDGKDIICASTQTACNLGCKFCFLSDYDLVVRSLPSHEMVEPIHTVIKDLGLPAPHSDVLLISFMGCGEPLCNIDNVVEAARQITEAYGETYRVVRFAVATLIPDPRLMQKLTDAVKEEGMPVKLHLSLHSPDDERRKTIMPSAYSIRESIELVEVFMQETGNSSEIHYALIDDVNDRDEDLELLIALLKGRNIPIKFLIYNEKPSVDFRRSQRVAHFRETLEREGIRTEFYIPPGGDIGSSCGQFLMDYYERFNRNTKQKQ